jgi:hypothetical protein
VARESSWRLRAAAAAVFAGLWASHLPAARVLRYATLHLSEQVTRAVLLSVLALALAPLYERLVRGSLYGALRRRLVPGLGAPAVAALGAFLPAALRLAVLPRPRAPFAVVAVHAYLVEAFLGLGLAFVALAFGSTIPGGLAAGLVWTIRALVVPVFHGGMVPVLELVSSALAAIGVAALLRKGLAPHGAAVMEA